MRRNGWTIRSSLWFVLLVAVGLKTAIGTWNNLKRGSVEYHRQLAIKCESMSARELRMVAHIEDEVSSGSISDPANVAEHIRMAKMSAQYARSNSLLAASLAKKAELCELSPVGWILLQYETSRNPPVFPVQHVSGRKTRPWLKSGTLLHSTISTLAHVDHFGLACLALAIVVRRRFANVGGRPPALTTL